MQSGQRRREPAGRWSALPWALALALAAASARADAPLGFLASSLEAQERAEAAFLRTPTPERARKWLARLTEEPHVAGTPQQRALVEYLRERLEEFGLDAELVRYDVFLNRPKRVSLRLVEPDELELDLIESFHARDKDSATRGVLPAFHGYGASGRARGQVVYANYGQRADFEQLERLGIPVEGRVVLARYGRVFRGLKVREAQERGAVAVVIYSDPADDGYMKGDVYPDGPMRPPSAIQRGSVQFLSQQPGDPSTPGYASTEGAERVPREQMATVPSIPSLPLGYGEAEKILRNLGGPGVPDDWQGGLPFAYHVGPGGASLEVEVDLEEGLGPIFDVFARIPGSEQPERLVILGNHNDAWTHGAVDPSSGTAVWLEAARALAAAVKAGWRPRRTVLLASWDAEEYGLVGSTEWGEDRAAELRERAVAYVNLDASVTGNDLEVAGSPSLRDVVREVARAVDEPLRGGSLADAWERRLRKEWARKGAIDLSRPDAPFEPHLAALGSGSDYTVFVDHLGVPSLSFSFRGKYGVYHSLYDNLRWMEEFGDPQFVYHAVAARFYGLLAMRLASADVVPLRFGSYGRALREELDELQREAIRRARAGSGGAGRPPPLEPDFGPLREALAALEAAGEGADRAVDALVARGDAARAKTASEQLIRLERIFLAEDGLPGRPWFRHLLYAPGFTTGYAPWPFPELREAVERRDEELFARGERRLLSALGRASAHLRAIGPPPAP